jgi:hypothetical protein
MENAPARWVREDPAYRCSASARFAAKYPHMPWTPTPGGVDAEQMYSPLTGVE